MFKEDSVGKYLQRRQIAWENMFKEDSVENMLKEDSVGKYFQRRQHGKISSKKIAWENIFKENSVGKYL